MDIEASSCLKKNNDFRNFANNSSCILEDCIDTKEDAKSSLASVVNMKTKISTTTKSSMLSASSMALVENIVDPRFRSFLLDTAKADCSEEWAYSFERLANNKLLKFFK